MQNTNGMLQVPHVHPCVRGYSSHKSGSCTAAPFPKGIAAAGVWGVHASGVAKCQVQRPNRPCGGARHLCHTVPRLLRHSATRNKHEHAQAKAQEV